MEVIGAIRRVGAAREISTVVYLVSRYLSRIASTQWPPSCV
jgi:hypothetical protein